MSTFTVSAPGKAILHGEHAVVYGKGAVAVSLGLRTHVTVSTDCKNQLQVFFQTLEFSAKWDLPNKVNFPVPVLGSKIIPVTESYLKNVSELFTSESDSGSQSIQSTATLLFLYCAMTQKYGNCLPKAVRVTVTSEIPIGAGLGSSASYTVCLSAALLRLYDQIGSAPGITDQELDLINQWAFQAETIHHGKPSGIDNSICSYGGALLFQNGQIVERIPKLPDIKILLINTDVPRNTKLLVALVKEKLDKYPGVMNPVLESIGSISLKQWAFLKGVGQQEFGEEQISFIKDMVTMNQHLLNCLGVGHPKLDEICQIASGLNLSAKLTGAGGGGCAIVFMNTTSNVSEVSKAFVDVGFKVSLAILAGHGVSFK